jgi:hypothetical protein
MENFPLKIESAEAFVSLFRLISCIRPGTIFHMQSMLRWRSTMRELSAEARLHLYARSVSRRSGTGYTAALYSALALIAAVVFGTLSVHPF